MNDYFQRSLDLHRKHRGKLASAAKVSLATQDDLSLAYTPGVARPCEEIAKDKSLANTLTIKGNSVAIVTDGSAVLGLGNIGPEAAMPVMEGKALLFKRYADIDAWPICLATQDTDAIIETVRNIAPGFGGINLEDISAPRCFEIEERLQDLGIPVFHDDQHGTAIVLVAALINSCRMTGRRMQDLRVVINGAGAAGTAIAQLLLRIGHPDASEAVGEVVMCDSRGSIHAGRSNLTPAKYELLEYTNPAGITGKIHHVMRGMDVFVGVSVGNLLKAEHVRTMNKDPLLFPMSNPIPEIDPEEAYRGGAAVVGTGRSDFPNQVNNVLAFPGIFRGALDAGSKRITNAMKLAATYALAECVGVPTRDAILPSPLELAVAGRVAEAVKMAAQGGEVLPDAESLLNA